MNEKRVDDIIAFALLVAARGDSAWDRELGPIHLLKAVYLADQAFAERQGGQTFTGAPWRFHHHGPWNAEVSKRVAVAASAAGAVERTVSSADQEDAVRWIVHDTSLIDDRLRALERRLPVEVASTIKRAVRQYGQATPELLHAVYQTHPMLRAVPGALLDFTPRVEEPHPEIRPREPQPLNPEQEEKRQERLRDLRERVRAKLQEPPPAHMRPLSPPPSYDEGFMEGLRWLDALAGAPIEEMEGELTIDERLWDEDERDLDVY